MNRGSRWNLALLAALLLGVYALVLWQSDWLRFPVDRDETHFWPTCLLFSGAALPDLQTLHGYNELSTPLPFIVCGQIQRVTGRGLVLSRYLNLALSALLLTMIACARGAPDRTSLASAFGLMLFPYFLGVSTRLYTDTMASFFAVAGLSLQLRRYYFSAAIAWVFGIASRQYVIAFPLAAAIAELTQLHADSAGDRGWWQPSWIWPLIAAGSLGCWFVFFHGFGPPAAISEQEIDTIALGTFHINHALYFLSCIGAYYCLPEAILIGTASLIEQLRKWRRVAILAALLGLVFVLFPPLANPDFSRMGYLDITLHEIAGDSARLIVFYVLALLALVRFTGCGAIAGWMLLTNVLVMTKAHLAWDKYALPLICALWFLSAWKDRTSGAGVPARARSATVLGRAYQ